MGSQNLINLNPGASIQAFVLAPLSVFVLSIIINNGFNVRFSFLIASFTALALLIIIKIVDYLSIINHVSTVAVIIISALILLILFRTHDSYHVQSIFYVLWGCSVFFLYIGARNIHEKPNKIS